VTHVRRLHIGPFVGGERPLPLTYQFQDSDGEPLNLTGYVARLVIKERRGTSTAYEAIVSDPTNGRVSYVWTGTELIVAGRYEAEFTVTSATNRFVSLRFVFDVIRPVGPTDP
jgi:BppU N-terminal domain